MNVNYELYRIFYVVATLGNITKASQELMISQPAVTKQIKKLEDQLGGRLFIRTKRGVLLTDNGKEIYQYVQQAMNCFETAQNHFSNLKELETGMIRIGVSTTLARIFLIPYLSKFHQRYPNISIQLFTDPSIVMRKKLKDGTLDLLVAKETLVEDQDLERIRVGKLHHVFIAGNTYSELKNRIIELEELKHYPILLPKIPSTSRSSFSQYCKEHKIEIDSKIEVASSSLLEDLVKIGFGIGLVTKEYAQKEIDSGEVFIVKTKYQLPSKYFSLITLKNSFHNFATNQLIEMILKDIQYTK